MMKDSEIRCFTRNSVLIVKMIVANPDELAAT